MYITMKSSTICVAWGDFLYWSNVSYQILDDTDHIQPSFMSTKSFSSRVKLTFLPMNAIASKVLWPRYILTFSDVIKTQYLVFKIYINTYHVQVVRILGRVYSSLPLRMSSFRYAGRRTLWKIKFQWKNYFL